MAGPGLRLEQAPPMSVPFRFFFSAPAFGLIASLALFWQGFEALGSRWSPAALAVTHLLTVGFMAMVMIGALMQVLPVMAGAPVPRPRLVAGVTHIALVLGTLALTGGFFWPEPWLMGIAVGLLGVAFAVFVCGSIFGLARARARGAAGFWLAIIALGIAVVIGLDLASLRAGSGLSAALGLRELHPAWALLGWTGLLVTTVARQVVPMFQMTPPYPGPIERFFSGTTFALIAIWSLALALQVPGEGIALAIGVLFLIFAFVTLELQRRRRRRVPDVTLQFWRLGMVALAVTMVAWCARLLGFPVDGFDPALGALAIVGAAMSLINGMLYKIAPFLAWFHLQALGGGRGMPMKVFLAERPQRVQFAFHLAAVLFFVSAAFGPAILVYPAAACLALSNLLLLSNLATIMRAYQAALPHAATKGPRAHAMRR